MASSVSLDKLVRMKFLSRQNTVNYSPTYAQPTQTGNCKWFLKINRNAFKICGESMQACCFIYTDLFKSCVLTLKCLEEFYLHRFVLFILLMNMGSTFRAFSIRFKFAQKHSPANQVTAF